jgi:UDP-2-acetamido-2,6-beta-L-arabino-hexul-4-ose reductase
VQILITGSDGFIGKNLSLFLQEQSAVKFATFTHRDPISDLDSKIADSDFVIHLAGVNRSSEPGDFEAGNVDLTKELCRSIQEFKNQSGKSVSIIYASSVQANLDNVYGVSKRAAERVLLRMQKEHGIPVHIFRLPNVFGKWCRPNYNSAVATFCNNVARGLPIEIHDASAKLELVYIDDAIRAFMAVVADEVVDVDDETGFPCVTPTYSTTVGEVACHIRSFKGSRDNLVIPPVGTGFVRALYSTYVSYLPTDAFAYPVPMHGDVRGTFVEMLKTEESGQFSFFTAFPGVTRGGHYHHSKTEKFLVIRGEARFKFRHMQSGETHELMTSGRAAEIVETVPGWTHDITNVGEDELIVMLWANEVFDRERPDTYASAV